MNTSEHFFPFFVLPPCVFGGEVTLMSNEPSQSSACFILNTSEHLPPPPVFCIVSMCIWKKSELGRGCCVMKADLLTAWLSAWNTKRQCFSWIGFKQRQSNFGMTISWGGLWWLAQYVSGYFGWLWLMVFLGNQTHRRPMRLWPASLAGQGKEGWIKWTTKTDKKREGVRKAATACQM